MPGQRHRYLHRVTYSECTVGNHIYYGRYLDILEAARGEFFRETGPTFSDWQAADLIFPVIEVQMRYRGAARYDDTLTVETWVTELEKVRLSFGCRITTAGGRPVLEGITRHVATSLQDKLTRLPAGLIEQLQPFLEVATEVSGAPV